MFILHFRACRYKLFHPVEWWLGIQTQADTKDSNYLDRCSARWCRWSCRDPIALKSRSFSPDYAYVDTCTEDSRFTLPLTMFVIEANNMHHLVDNGGVFHTTVIQGQHLYSGSPADFGEASVDQNRWKFYMSVHNTINSASTLNFCWKKTENFKGFFIRKRCKIIGICFGIVWAFVLNEKLSQGLKYVANGIFWKKKGW